MDVEIELASSQVPNLCRRNGEGLLRNRATGRAWHTRERKKNPSRGGSARWPVNMRNSRVSDKIAPVFVRNNLSLIWCEDNHAFACSWRCDRRNLVCSG